MRLLLLLATALVSPAASAWLFGSGCDDSYLNKTNLLERNPKDAEHASSVYDFYAKDIDGAVVSLKEKYKGKVLMVVNAATECGLTTRNYAQLADLMDQHAKRGLQVLIFPSNSFNQEHKTNPEIKEWNSKHRGASFNVFSRIAVNGDCTHPLYTYLKQGGILSFIKWNYTKFLIDRSGRVVKRYAPTTDPVDAEKDIEAELAKEVPV